MELRVLTWNLQHGRANPSAGHALFGAFAAALAGWSWDVALLQEVPPWWPDRLAERLSAEARLVLTSRNVGLALRRAVAVRRPDLIKSNGGGGNAILVRKGDGVLLDRARGDASAGGGDGGAVPGRDDAITDHRTLRLRRLPERRWVHAVRTRSGVWIANLHVGNGNRAAEHDSRVAGRAVLGWAGGAPVVLGGDFNLHAVQLSGFVRAGGHGVDQVFVAGGHSAPDVASVLDRGRLSDHAPVVVTVEVP